MHLLNQWMPIYVRSYDVEDIIDGFHFETFIVDKLIKISQNEKMRKYLISFIISAEMTSFYLPDKG